MQAAGVGAALLLAAAGLLLGACVLVGLALAGRRRHSGASREPHLHAQHAPAPGVPPISGVPLPVRIDGRFLVRNDRLPGRAVGP